MFTRAYTYVLSFAPGDFGEQHLPTGSVFELVPSVIYTDIKKNT
jgi:hypothetical protein